jgi:hypothetical protein
MGDKVSEGGNKFNGVTSTKTCPVSVDDADDGKYLVKVTNNEIPHYELMQFCPPSPSILYLYA